MLKYMPITLMGLIMISGCLSPQNVSESSQIPKAPSDIPQKDNISSVSYSSFTIHIIKSSTDGKIQYYFCDTPYSNEMFVSEIRSFGGRDCVLHVKLFLSKELDAKLIFDTLNILREGNWCIVDVFVVDHNSERTDFEVFPLKGKPKYSSSQRIYLKPIQIEAITLPKLPKRDNK